jgi:raffinose/stachyose/melibiose transport system substrate-binding protein
MKKEKKMSAKMFYKLFAVLAVLSFALAACGGGGAAAPTTVAPATAAPATVAPATVAPATVAPATATPAKKQAMTAMFLGTTQDVAVLAIIKQVTDQFNANNPYNVEFSYETYGNDDYKTKLPTVMAANDAPDVFFTWSAGFLKPYVEGGKVYEVGQLLNADAEWKGRFIEGVFGPLTYDGKIYAVPQGQTVGVMFYNTRLFEKYNVTVPTTYNELLQAVDTFKKNGITPISVPGQEAWVPGQFLQMLANINGGIDLFNGTVAGTTVWNDPAYVKAGSMFQELIKHGAFQDGFMGMSTDEGRLIFGQEKTAMYYMGSWDMNVLSDPKLPVSKNIGVFNIGDVALGDADQALAISAKTANPQAAAAYIKMFSDVAAQEAYAYNASYLISTKTPLDQSKLSPLFLAVSNLKQGFKGLTPWFDRVFGAGEGGEWNNAAVAIAGGTDPAKQMGVLQQYLIDNPRK